MAGTSSKTEVMTIRVPVVFAADWKAKAQARGITVSAYILERALRGGSQSSRPLPSVEAIDPKASHSVGPILADPVPRAATGLAIGFNLKGQTKGKGRP